MCVCECPTLQLPFTEKSRNSLVPAAPGPELPLNYDLQAFSRRVIDFAHQVSICTFGHLRCCGDDECDTFAFLHRTSRLIFWRSHCQNTLWRILPCPHVDMRKSKKNIHAVSVMNASTMLMRGTDVRPAKTFFPFSPVTSWTQKKPPFCVHVCYLSFLFLSCHRDKAYKGTFEPIACD